MGILAIAADILGDESRTFSPAAAPNTSGWTLRDALIAAMGCDRNAGFLAYWEWRQIQDTLAAARQRLHPHTGAPPAMDAERWANQPDRTLNEVVAALDAARRDGDIDAPRVTIRPWCDPKTPSTCRVPFVPLAALTHTWTQSAGPWRDLVERYQLTPSTSPWEMLDAIDPDIRNTTMQPSIPEDAAALRDWMGRHAGTTSPTDWLFAVCADDTHLDDLLGRAGQTGA